jgi:hypothetical protein
MRIPRGRPGNLQTKSAGYFELVLPEVRLDGGK